MTVLNSAGNAAYVHELKCWLENFDAIVSGAKRCEVRTEEDRQFKAGDMVRLVRTDHEGRATEPRVSLLIEITHVERTAGPFEICAAPPDDGGGLLKRTPVAVLSLMTNRITKVTDTPTVKP